MSETNEELARGLAIDLYDRFMMGGHEPSDHFNTVLQIILDAEARGIAKGMLRAAIMCEIGSTPTKPEGILLAMAEAIRDEAGKATSDPWIESYTKACAQEDALLAKGRAGRDEK